MDDNIKVVIHLTAEKRTLDLGHIASLCRTVRKIEQYLGGNPRMIFLLERTLTYLTGIIDIPKQEKAAK